MIGVQKKTQVVQILSLQSTKIPFTASKKLLLLNWEKNVKN